MASVFMGKVFTSSKSEAEVEEQAATSEYYLNNLLSENMRNGVETRKRVEEAQKVGYFLLSESAILTADVCEAASHVLSTPSSNPLTPASIRRLLLQLKSVADALRGTAYWELLLNNNLLLKVSETAQSENFIHARYEGLEIKSPSVLKSNLNYLSTTLVDALSLNCLILCYSAFWVNRVVKNKSMRWHLDIHHGDCLLLSDVAQRCAFWYFLHDSPSADSSLKSTLTWFVAEVVARANTPLNSVSSDTIFSHMPLSIRSINTQVFVSKENGKVSLYGNSLKVPHVWDSIHALSGFSKESGLDPTLFFEELADKYANRTATSKSVLYDKYRTAQAPLNLEFFSSDSISSLLLRSLKNAVMFHDQLNLFYKTPLYSRLNMYTLFEALFQTKLSFWDTGAARSTAIKQKLLALRRDSLKRILELISFEVLGCLVGTHHISHLLPKSVMTTYVPSSKLSDNAAAFQRTRVGTVFKNVSFISGMEALMESARPIDKPLNSPAIPSQIAVRQMSLVMWQALRERCLQEETAKAAACWLYQEFEQCVKN